MEQGRPRQWQLGLPSVVRPQGCTEPAGLPPQSPPQPACLPPPPPCGRDTLPRYPPVQVWAEGLTQVAQTAWQGQVSDPGVCILSRRGLLGAENRLRRSRNPGECAHRRIPELAGPESPLPAWSSGEDSEALSPQVGGRAGAHLQLTLEPGRPCTWPAPPSAPWRCGKGDNFSRAWP